MLYVRFVGLVVLRLFEEVWFEQLQVGGSGEWSLLAWPEEGGSEFQYLNIRGTPLNVYTAPTAVPSYAQSYYSGLEPTLSIDCPTKKQYYYYADWLTWSSVDNIGAPLNDYGSSKCLVHVKKAKKHELNLEPPESLETIVPTQLSGFI